MSITEAQKLDSDIRYHPDTVSPGQIEVHRAMNQRLQEICGTQDGMISACNEVLGHGVNGACLACLQRFYKEKPELAKELI